VGFCICFPYFETEFNTNYLLLYQLHTNREKTTTHSITKLVIKTKRDARSIWNKMPCVTNGQVARSIKQHLMWLMQCWFWDRFWECFEHTIYISNHVKLFLILIFYISTLLTEKQTFLHIIIYELNCAHLVCSKST
jgi:hypothetical protein